MNGIKIHYVEEGDRDKPMMLFVHGFPEFWYSWRHQMKYFAKEGYYVVALDLPGYGDSEKPDNLDQYHVKVREENKNRIKTSNISSKFWLQIRQLQILHPKNKAKQLFITMNFKILCTVYIYDVQLV